MLPCNRLARDETPPLRQHSRVRRCERDGACRADKGRSRVLISVIGEQYNQPPIYLCEQLPLDEKAVARLTQIGKGLGGDPAAAVGALLAEIESQSEPWVPAGPGPAPAGAAPGRQGLPGHDHH